MRHIQYSIVVLTTMLLLSACVDNTESLGIYAQTDGITNSDSIFELTTRSVKMDSVLANSVINYLGCITDPETGTDISADFAAQFSIIENYKFPNKSQMVGDVNGTATQGIVQCDSCEVRLYFNSYYGDDDNPMKIEVYQLSQQPDRIMNEDSVYYTDINLSKFLDDGAQPIATRVFTPKDFNLSNIALASSTYSQNVQVVLPKSVGQKIMDSYFENPRLFANSYRFIRNVFPGLYFRTIGGKGTMLSVYVGTVNLFYRYRDEAEDTTYVGYTRMAATPEVIQSTHFSNSNIDHLLAVDTCTYLKTPAGICTEMTLPIDQIFSGNHVNDSISMASITLTRYNKPQDSYQLGTPQELLMVRKKDVRDFFLKHHVTNGRTSYTTTFNSTYNTYTFNNIGRLLTYCKHEKENELRLTNEERERQGLTALTESEWMQQNPDWDKVWLVPVTTGSTSTSTSTSQVSVTHDLSLSSIRLVGGTTKLKMQVIYSKYYQE